MDRKTIFDIIRRALGRPFRQREVDAIDAALDREGFARVGAGSGQAVPPAKDDAGPRKVGPRGIALIKAFEGCARDCGDGTFEAYPDPGSPLARTGSGSGAPWTIGWGATGRDHTSGGRIAQGTRWTRAQCDARLEADLVRYAAEVEAAIGDAPTSEAQFDALVSFHYNTGAIARATLTRRHRAGDTAGAVREFARWCHAGNRVLKGLVRRRAAEAALYRR